MSERRGVSRYRRVSATRPLKAVTLPPAGAEAVDAGAVRYQAEIDPASDSTHARVVRLVGTDKRVLELGCSTGYMSRVLRDRGCRVVAVEQDAAAAALARPFCERIIVGDVERLDLGRTLGKDRFDVVVAADVLEHLKDPRRLLRALRTLIRPDGYVVASLPNVAHGSVRLALLAGAFKYTELGLLDRTHLRFYTRESMEELFEQAEYAIGYLERQILPLGATEVAHDAAAVPRELVEKLSRDPEALTYQFIVAALPMPSAHRHLIQRRLHELAAEKADALRQAHDAAESREVAERRIDELAAKLEAAVQEIQSIREARDSVDQQRLSVVRENEAVRERVRNLEQENDAFRAAHDGLVASKDASGAEAELLREAVAQQARGLGALTTRMERADAEAVELRRVIQEAKDQVLRRETELAAAAGELALTRAGMLGMQATKVWRIGKCYWWIEARVKSLFRSRTN